MGTFQYLGAATESKITTFLLGQDFLTNIVFFCLKKKIIMCAGFAKGCLPTVIM